MSGIHIDICKSKRTFVDVPHNSSVVDRPRHHEVSIPCPADVIHILYMSPEDKSNDKKSHFRYKFRSIGQQIAKWTKQVDLHTQSNPILFKTK